MDKWFDVLLGVLVAVLAWASSRLHNRVDELEKNSVTKADFQLMLIRIEKNGDRMEQASKDMHKENKEHLEKIHDRVDDMWERRRLARAQGRYEL